MVTICRLCLKSPKDKSTKFYDIFHLDDCGATPYGYIHDVIPEILLSVSEKPVLCQQCYDQTKNFYYFKKICLVSDQLIRIYTSNKAKSLLNNSLRLFIKLEDVVNYWRTIYKKYKDTEFATEVVRDRLEAIFGEAIESEKVAEVPQANEDFPKEKTSEKPFTGLIVNVDIAECEGKMILQEIRNEIVLGNLNLSHLIDSLDNYILGHVVEPCETPTFSLIRKSIHISKHMDEALRKSDERLQGADSKKYSDLIILRESRNTFEVVHMKEALPVKVLYKSKRKLVKDLFLLPNGDVELGSVIKDKVSSQTKENGKSEEDSDSADCFIMSERTPSPPVLLAPEPMPLIRVRPMSALQKGPCDKLQQVNAGGNVSIQQVISKPPLIIPKKMPLDAQQQAVEFRYLKKPQTRPYEEVERKQAVEAVINGGRALDVCRRYGVPRSTLQNHVREARNKSILKLHQTAAIPLNTEVKEIPDVTSDQTYVDEDSRSLIREDSGPRTEVYLTEEELLEITEDENVQSTILAVNRELVNLNDANVEPPPLDLEVDAVDNMILVSPRDHRRVQVEHREEIFDTRRKSVQLGDNLSNEFAVELPQVQPIASPVKKKRKPRTKKSTENSTTYTQSNIIDIRMSMCKTEKEIQRDRRKALVDSFSAGSGFDTSACPPGDVHQLFAKFTSDGDYINDHDYLRSPYMRCQMVENAFCVCMLCGQRQLGRNHVKHLKRHETKCRLCNAQFDDIFHMNLHAYSHCHYCDECKTNVFYYSYETHLKTHITKWNKPKKPLKSRANKDAAVNTQTTPKQSLGEPNCVLKLLLDNAMDEDPKLDKIWHLVQSPASSTTESASLTERDESPLTISELLNSSVVPDKSAQKLVDPDPEEVILLTEEEIEELCSKTKTKRNETRPLKSVTDILADIKRNKAADEKPCEEVLDSSNLPLLKNPPNQENTGNSEQDLSEVNPNTTSKEPTDNKIVHRHNTRSKSKHSETSKDGCHDATKSKCCESPLHVPKRRKSVFVPELNDFVGSLVTSGEEALLPIDDLTMPKLSKTPLVLEPNARKRKKNIFMDGTKEQEKSEVEPTQRDSSVESSLVNSNAKRSRKSLFVPEDESIEISDNAKVIRSKTPSLLENKSRARRKSVFVPEEECAANLNEACLKEGETMGNCNKTVEKPKISSPEEPPLEVSSGDSMEPKRSKTPSILKTKSRARRKSLFNPELEEPNEPMKVSSEKTPSILQTKSRARSKSMFIPEVDKSEEELAGNTNEDSSKVGQTSMENRRSLFMPEWEELKESCLSQSPSKVTLDDLTRPKQIVEPKPRKCRKKVVPELEEPKATSVEEPLKVSSGDSTEPKRSKTPSILQTKFRARSKSMFIPEADNSEEKPGNMNDDSSKVGQTSMENRRSVFMPEWEELKESCLNQSPSKVTSDDLTRPKQIMEPKPRKCRKKVVPELEEPKATSDEPLKVSSGDSTEPKRSKTPSILQTKFRARSKSMFIPEVYNSEEKPGNMNEDSSKVSQTSMENRRSVFMPELEEPKESCLNQAPSKVTSNDSTRPKQIMEPKPRKRRKRLIPEVEEPKATSDEPLKVSSSDLMEPKRSKTPSILQTKSRTRKKNILPHVEDSQTINNHPETTPILNSKSRLQGKGVFMGDSHVIIAPADQTSDKRAQATPELLPGSSSNAPLLEKELVVCLERMPSEALRLGYMLEQLKKRSLQAMEAQRKNRSLWKNTIEENNDRPISTTKTPETDEIGDTPLHPKKSSKSQEPVNLFGEGVGPSVIRKKQKIVDPINQGKTKVAPIEKTKVLTVSLEAIERLSEETRIRISKKVKKRKYAPSNEPPKQIVREDDNTFDSQSSTGLTDDYEVALPENLTLMEVFPPGAEDLGFTEADDVDIEG